MCFSLLPQICSTDQQALDVTWECVRNPVFRASPYICGIKIHVSLGSPGADTLKMRRAAIFSQASSPLPTAVGGPLPSLPSVQYSQFFLEALVHLRSLYTAADQHHQRARYMASSTCSGKRQHKVRPLRRISSTNCCFASLPSLFEYKFSSGSDFHFRSCIERY